MDGSKQTCATLDKIGDELFVQHDLVLSLSPLIFSQHPLLEPLRLPAPVGGPRQVPPEGVQPESPAAAAEEEAREPGLQVAGFVRESWIFCRPETNKSHVRLTLTI